MPSAPSKLHFPLVLQVPVASIDHLMISDFWLSGTLRRPKFCTRATQAFLPLGGMTSMISSGQTPRGQAPIVVL